MQKWIADLIVIDAFYRNNEISLVSRRRHQKMISNFRNVYDILAEFLFPDYLIKKNQENKTYSLLCMPSLIWTIKVLLNYVEFSCPDVVTFFLIFFSQFSYKYLGKLMWLIIKEHPQPLTTLQPHISLHSLWPELNFL